MDTNEYDVGRLELEELIALRDLQRKMLDGPPVDRKQMIPPMPEDLARLTLDELLRLERLYYKMEGKPYPWDHHATVHETDLPSEPV